MSSRRELFSALLAMGACAAGWGRRCVGPTRSARGEGSARGRCAALLFLCVVGLNPISAQEASTLRGLERIPSLEGRIRAIETFVDRRYYDAAGMMFSHSNWREERPFVASDFSAQDSTIPGPEAHAWLSYENSVMVAGLFLSAQCYRYEVTGEAAALDLARRAFEAISANYALTENRPTGATGVRQKAGIVEQPVAGQRREAGFFCKPYYGQATDHTSTEQHFWPVLGLYRYWKHAPAEIRPRIAQMLREVSERWRRGYRINFFGETWDFEQSYPRAQRHMFSWAVIHRLAYEVTGDADALAEFRRLDSLYGAMPTPRETYWGLGRSSYISTEDRSFHIQLVVGADVLLDLEPAGVDRYRRGIEQWWRYSQLGQRDDLLSYYFIEVDALSGTWRKAPPSTTPRALWRTNYAFHHTVFPICWQGTRERQALSSAIVARRLPGLAEEARKRRGACFAGLDRDHFRWMVDPENVTPVELRWMLNVLQGDSLAFYPLAYWYGRAHGVEGEWK